MGVLFLSEELPYESFYAKDYETCNQHEERGLNSQRYCLSFDPFWIKFYKTLTCEFI